MGTDSCPRMGDCPPIGSDLLAPPRFQPRCLRDHRVVSRLVPPVCCCPIFLSLQSMEAGRSRSQQSGVHRLAEHRVCVPTGSSCRHSVVFYYPFVGGARWVAINSISLTMPLNAESWHLDRLPPASAMVSINRLPRFDAKTDSW